MTVFTKLVSPFSMNFDLLFYSFINHSDSHFLAKKLTSGRFVCKLLRRCHRYSVAKRFFFHFFLFFCRCGLDRTFSSPRRAWKIDWIVCFNNWTFGNPYFYSYLPKLSHKYCRVIYKAWDSGYRIIFFLYFLIDVTVPSLHLGRPSCSYQGNPRRGDCHECVEEELI